MSLSGKARVKSKSQNERTKKYQPRVDAIKVSVERKKKCNDKALKLVMDFSEGTVSEKMLLDNLQFINQEYYQDIVEERAINKLCGYPLCPNVLKNIPSKQYHISTTLNKVFDITDRKNFCSNLCYKASKILKDQISTSPLWLREEESQSFTLISLQSTHGMTGDEVDLGISPVKLDLDDLLTTPSSKLDESSNSEVLNDEFHSKNSEKCKTSEDKDLKFVEDETYFESLESSECESFSSCKSDCNVDDQDAKQEISSETKICTVTISETDKSNDSVDSPRNRECHSYQISKIQESVEIIIQEKVEEGNKQLVSQTLDSKEQPRISESKTHHKHLSKRKLSNSKASVNANPLQNIVLKIEKILREWISLESLCFILGEEKIKEVLAEKKTQNLPAFTQDVHLYERYLAICKKLNLLELEETKIDASYREEAKKPLPDYEALKEEARQMDIKVKMFYKGDKVQFEDPEVKKDAEVKSEAADSQPVLPLVDVHAQKALRRRIVVDKLRKVLQDLQKSLGLRGFNLTEDIRTLVGTLTLSAHNITMKPAEWNLVSIAIIKLLSLRDETLSQALTSSTANKHLTLLLMSFSLDPAYLDRLMVWLTDVEAVLQKT